MTTCLETWIFGTNYVLLGGEILFLLVRVLLFKKQLSIVILFWGRGSFHYLCINFHQRFRFDIVLFPVILSLIVLIVIYLHAKVGTRVYFFVPFKEKIP